MGDDERRAVQHQIAERLLHQPLRLGVERRGRLVENEDGRVLEQRPGDGQPLPLPAGQPLPAFANRGAIPVGHGGDELVRVRRPCRGLDLGVGRSGRAVCDVARDGVVEEHRVLGDHRDLLPQRGHGAVADVAAVEQDDALGHVEEPRDQVDQRRLAGAAQADDGHHLPGVDGKADVTQDAAAVTVLVMERDTSELDTLLERRQRCRSGTIAHFRVRVEHPEDALAGGNRLLHGGIDAAQFLRPDRTSGTWRR